VVGPFTLEQKEIEIDVQGKIFNLESKAYTTYGIGYLRELDVESR
jgi:hypothetical protein